MRRTRTDPTRRGSKLASASLLFLMLYKITLEEQNYLGKNKLLETHPLETGERVHAT